MTDHLEEAKGSLQDSVDQSEDSYSFQCGDPDLMWISLARASLSAQQAIGDALVAIAERLPAPPPPHMVRAYNPVTDEEWWFGPYDADTAIRVVEALTPGWQTRVYGPDELPPVQVDTEQPAATKPEIT